MQTVANELNKSYTLQQLVSYFFKLGYSGFGGPVALVGYMHRDLVEERGWITEQEYKEGLALAQLAPGPLAAQLCIYLGYVHYKILGATLAGLAFVIPSFIMVVLLGMVYKLFGGLPWMQSVFYGVGAAVIGIIAFSSYKLSIKSVGKLSLIDVKKNWILWLFYICAAIITWFTESEQVIYFILAGLIYMFIKAPPRWNSNRKTVAGLLVFLNIGFWEYKPGILSQMAIFFTKAGAFVFGSGLAIVPFLHGSVVKEFHWLNEQQFVDAVAVAMITPGPVVITVGFIGYLVAGFPGATVAALATFLPCYLFTVIPAPYFKRISNNLSVKYFVEGITAAVVGALIGSVIIISRRTILDINTAGIALVTVLAILKFHKLKEPYIILVAALIGFILKTFL